MSVARVQPTVAVLLGDPAGVGPELVAKLLSREETWRICRPVVVGDPAVLAAAISALGMKLRIRAVAEPSAQPAAGEVEVVKPAGLPSEPVPPAVVSVLGGKSAAAAFDTAYALVARGLVQAVAAAPMNKQAFHDAGYNYLDELEYLSDVTHSPDALMLGAVTDSLWTIAVTGHLPFSDIPKLITRERVLANTRRLAEVLRMVGHAQPRIAVAALNVHGGEGGMFGREEIDAIAPAIEDARRAGIEAIGPVPADTVFVRARTGEFQGIVCMYHDQANIGRKLMATRRGATVYLGLPVVCTTTAHGTGFDLVGKGIAEVGSLADALAYAVALAAK